LLITLPRSSTEEQRHDQEWEDEELEMFAMTRPRLLITFIVMLLFATFLVFAAFSPTASADHSWNGYHWASTTNPVKVTVGDNLSGVWDQRFSYTDPDPDNAKYNLTNADYLQTALSDRNLETNVTAWNEPPVLNLQDVAGGTSASTGKRTPKNCAATSGRVEVCNYSYGNKGWVGLTSVWTSDDHFTQATSKLNDTYLNNPRRYPTYSNSVWRLGTLCHELGHAIGLDHQDVGSCMDNVSTPGSEDMRPNYHDYEQLDTIYGHTDGTNTSSSVAGDLPAALKDIDTTDPAQRGRLIRKSEREEVYLRDLGGGHKVFTFVHLVKEEDRQQRKQTRQQQEQTQPQQEQQQDR
jgi:hypothetical protein